MNFIKKITAALLVVLMALTVVACHPKDEVAVTVGDVEFTSAYYMCALIFADSEARQKVDEQLAEKSEDKESTTSTEAVDYYKQKIDKKKYIDWVEDKAIENLKQIAAYLIKCKEGKVELDDETKANAEQYAAAYWSYYGYSALLEPNGVSEATYKKYMLDTYYASEYFEHLYGEGGSKEIAADEVKNLMLENMVIADLIEVDTSSMKDEEKTETKAKFDAYLNDLTSGAKTFEDVYNDYNDVKPEEEKTETEADTEESTEKEDTEEETEEEEAPLDEYATILSNDKIESYKNDLYDDVKAMAVGEIKLIEKEEGAGYALVIKQDISADPYYLKNLDLVLRDAIKGEEYEKDMTKYAEGLNAEINKYAVNQFKVKKIVYPETGY